MTTAPTQQELLNRYIAHADDLAAQSQGNAPDIGRRAIALYGSADAAHDLLSRFAVDVVGSSEHKQ